MLGNVLAVRCLVFGEALFLLVVWLKVLIFVVYFVLELQGTQVCTFYFRVLGWCYSLCWMLGSGVFLSGLVSCVFPDGYGGV